MATYNASAITKRIKGYGNTVFFDPESGYALAEGDIIKVDLMWEIAAVDLHMVDDTAKFVGYTVDISAKTITIVTLPTDGNVTGHILGR